MVQARTRREHVCFGELLQSRIAITCRFSLSLGQSVFSFAHECLVNAAFPSRKHPLVSTELIKLSCIQLVCAALCCAPSAQTWTVECTFLESTQVKKSSAQMCSLAKGPKIDRIFETNKARCCTKVAKVVVEKALQTSLTQLVVNDGVFSYWCQMVCFIGDVDCIAKIYLVDSK